MNDNAAVVDGHVHFWDRDRFDYPWHESADPGIRQNFLPANLAEAGLGGIVFVTADPREDQTLGEAAWVNELALEGAPIIAIVAQAQVELGAGCAPHLAELAKIPLVTGVRRLIQDQAPGYSVQPDFIRGVQLLAAPAFTFDLCVRTHQIPEVTSLVEQCPEVQFVLDHVGKPVISTDAFAGWSDDLSRLAALPNVRCKLSGLFTEAPPALRTAEGLRPWLRHALEVFGPERCLFGSDWPWPVVATSSGFDLWLAIVTAALDDLTPSQRDQVLRSTARETYLRS